MSDSVDRVFSHALNTVKRIRTSSTKPPPASRLLLYGLYKQSMEGNVIGVMDRPDSNASEAEKWDAWKAQEGLSKTEAKKKYVTTLIETMHVYATDTQEARELVDELEFVWDQVRGNLDRGSGSEEGSSPVVRGGEAGGYLGNGQSEEDEGGGGMRVLSPVSHPDEEGVEEFVDAQDSQFNEYEVEGQGQVRDSGAVNQPPSKPRSQSPRTKQWKEKMEQALIKTTTEVAALREQLETRRWYSSRQRKSLLSWLGWFAVAAVKHIAVDLLLFTLLILWLRRKKDRRLEGAVRVLLGDAVAQVQKIGEAQRAKIQLPKLPSRKA